MLNNYSLEKHMHKCFMIICTKNRVLPMQSWQNILHFSSGHSVGHVKKVWPFQEKILNFFPWNLSVPVTGKKIKRLYFHFHWKIITIGPYSCLLYRLKKTGHSVGHPPVYKNVSQLQTCYKINIRVTCVCFHGILSTRMAFVSSLTMQASTL